MARLVVEDFPQKIDLLFRSGRGKVTSLQGLSLVVDFVAMEYLQRVVNGDRPLSRSVFAAIVNKVGVQAGLQQSDWFEPLASFAAKLGFSPSSLGTVATGASRGIDFRCRNTDPQNMQNLFGLIGGYWEAFHYAMSIADRQCITHDLVVIDAPDDAGFLPCRVLDDEATYAGHCFPVHTGFIYILVEKVGVHDEIAMYLLGRPERARQPELDGIVLCTSSGVDDLIHAPSAVRIAFRYLAATPAELLRLYPTIHQQDGELFEEAARRTICTPYFIDSAGIDPGDARLNAVKGAIANTVAPDQIPYTLRLYRNKRKIG